MNFSRQVKEPSSELALSSLVELSVASSVERYVYPQIKNTSYAISLTYWQTSHIQSGKYCHPTLLNSALLKIREAFKAVGLSKHQSKVM